jgi:hypothetical protein
MVCLFDMKEMRRHITAALAILLLVCLDAGAQRTMRGQMFMNLEGQWPVGASVGVGQYLIPGYWDAGFDLMRMHEPLRLDGAVEDTFLESWQLKAGGGFMFRLLSTRSRSLSVYGGGDAWVGLEEIDPRHLLPTDVVLTIDTGRKFVFGATPRLEAEIYLGRHFALVLGGQVPVAFLSRIRYASPQGTAGIRIAF